MALNKFWGHCDYEMYMRKMSVPMVQEAIRMSGMPQEVVSRIWEEELPEKPEIKWTSKTTRRV